jgi:hypothetical protein
MNATINDRGSSRHRPRGNTAGSAPKTKDQPLFSLWKDREDMSDPASYVRQLRVPRRAAVEPAVKKHLRVRMPK